MSEEVAIKEYFEYVDNLGVTVGNCKILTYVDLEKIDNKRLELFDYEVI